mmetsp:Transcript_4191/g.6112  ORF Transcript_4191/g.6112 Transcript_4191/m.6112 type:complete len:385 (-) Transcript_4191:320-1474(-)
MMIMSSTPPRRRQLSNQRNHHRPSIKQHPKGAKSFSSPSKLSSLSATSSPASSSSPWKQALKQNCIERARKKRRDLVLRSRTSLAVAGSSSLPSSPFHVLNQPKEEAARNVVEEELRASGCSVAVASSPFSVPTTLNLAGARPSLDSVTSSLGAIPENNLFASQNMIEEEEEHLITEQEYLELMKEVEEELQREEAMLAEEVRERKREMECMEAQIAEYEEWCYNQEDTFTTPRIMVGQQQQQPQHLQSQMQLQHQQNEAPSVACPICVSGFLCHDERNHCIFCTNHHRNTIAAGATASSSCSFCWSYNKENMPQLHSSQMSSPLLCVKDQIQLAYEEHSAVCGGMLRFWMDHHSSLNAGGGYVGRSPTLRAGCETCHANVPIL